MTVTQMIRGHGSMSLSNIVGSLLCRKRSKSAQGQWYAQIVMERVMLVNIDISSQLFLTTNRH